MYIIEILKSLLFHFTRLCFIFIVLIIIMYVLKSLLITQINTFCIIGSRQMLLESNQNVEQITLLHQFLHHSRHTINKFTYSMFQMQCIILQFYHNCFCKGHHMYFVSSFIVTISLCIFNICTIYKIYSEYLFFFFFFSFP